MKIKKIISIFAALGASLMIASAVSAAPHVEYTATPLTDEDVMGYFGETLADYDAYMLTISLTPGVELNTTNTMNPSGLLLGGFETTLAISAEDLAKIETTGYSSSVEYPYTPEKDLFAGDGYTFILGNGKKGACFPAKNTTVAADSENVLSNTVVFVLKGQSVTMTVDKISLNYMQMTNGNQTTGTDLDMYNMVNEGEKTITYNTKTITLGEVEEEPTTNEQYFYATVEAIKDNYLEFQFDSNNDDKADLGYDYYMGTMTASKDDPLTVGLKYTGTQTLDLTKVIWSKIDHKANN